MIVTLYCLIFIFAISLSPAASYTILPSPWQAWQKFLKPMRNQLKSNREQVAQHFAGIEKYGGNEMVVKHLYTTKQTCVKMYDKPGKFDAVMYKPYTNRAKLTHYKTGPGGGCGVDTSEVRFNLI
jgi:uncharacterized membrane protein YjdF